MHDPLSVPVANVVLIQPPACNWHRQLELEARPVFRIPTCTYALLLGTILDSGTLWFMYLYMLSR
ncbi:hypothetical protein BDW71DRAFT_108887 [Aspergillus fruticulosus]